MSTLIMDPAPTVRAPQPASNRPPFFAACLRRCAEAGLKVVINAPADVRVFHRSLTRFPERQIDPAAHARWETAYRIYSNRSRRPHDRGSWHVLMVDSNQRVVGAITARIFCGEVVRDYVHTFSLLETTGPVFREHCEIAFDEVCAAAAKAGRVPAEFSHWSAAPGPHDRLVAATLARAMATLVSAFDAPLGITAADHRRGEVARLMRLGGAPLGRAGKFSLPPFVHHASGAWLRLLLIDARVYYARSGGRPKEDLALLRAKCPVFSAG